MTDNAQAGVSLKWLTPNELDVEPLAQREFRPANAEKIVKNYDPDKVGILTVSSRDGHLYVTDGQHRRAALIELGLGDVPVPCNVWEDRTIGDDAKQFVAYNVDNTKVGAIDAFRVKVVAGDEEAMAIKTVLDEFDLRVTYSAGVNDISAIGALYWVYRRGGNVLLVRTLTLIEATWNRDRQGRDGNIIKAVALILDKVDGLLDVESFALKVQADSTPGRVLGTARTHAMATRKALYVQAAEVMINIYNKQRSKNRVHLT
jgi:hypothetical protein